MAHARSARCGGRSRLFALAAAMLAGACGGAQEPAPRATQPMPRRPSILLVTLDTTRADAIGPEASGVETPAFNALAARGLRFRQAYATVPETLPSHASMMTGLYPAGHGVHENARYLAAEHPVARRAARSRPAIARPPSSPASSWRAASASPAGSTSTTTSCRRGEPSGRARETTDRALALPGRGSARGPLFLWVHYFDPHAPYAPPEPFRSRYARQPYLGEVAAMDEQLGRLVRGLRAAGAGAGRDRRRRATTARGSATTARPSTGTSSTSRRCTCPCCSSGRASRRA